MSGSARVLVKGVEGDSLGATKKVKDRVKELNGKSVEVIMEDSSVVQEKLSFHKALLSVPGLSEEEDSFEDWEEEELPENRWYVDQEEIDAKREEALAKKVVYEGGIPIIHVSDDELKDWSKPWRLTLVVNVMGKKLNYRVLENKINRDWAIKGHVKIIDMPRGFYAVLFDSAEDYQHALYKGPWMVANHYLLVQRWHQNFLKTSQATSKVAVWVRVLELPLELYNKRFLSRLGSALGSFLKMDDLTMFQCRGQFARFCAEIDLAKPLVPHVMVRGEKIRLEYEGLHAVCFGCGVYGHQQEACPVKQCNVVSSASNGGEVGMQVPSEKMIEDVVGGSVSAIECAIALQEAAQFVGADARVESQDGVGEQGDFGPWMLSKRDKRKCILASKGPRRIVADNRVKGQADFMGSSADFVVDKVEGAVGSVSEKLCVLVKGKLAADPPTGLGTSGVVHSGVGPAPKVRNQLGRKNPQVGPRFRDAKKAARKVGPYKKASKASDPEGLKVNSNPYSKPFGYGSLGLVTLMDSERVDVNLLKKMFYGEVKTPAVEINVPSCSSGDKGGLISPCAKVDGPKEAMLVPGQQSEGQGVVTIEGIQVGGLLEHKTTNGST